MPDAEYALQSLRYRSAGDRLFSSEITGTSPIGKTDDDDESKDPLEQTETEKQRTDDIPLTTPAALTAINRIKSELKFLCSLQVHKSTDLSATEEVHPISSDQYTTLEPSFNLPLTETFSLEELLNSQDNPSSNTPTTNQWLTDLPLDSFEEFLSLNSDMTFKELSNMSMEHNDGYSQESSNPTSSSSSFPYPQAVATQDDATSSSNDSSVEENERDAINRRGLKKSGGPLRKLARFGNKQVIKYSDDYHDRRVKNNEAVKKSRMKAKEKHKETEVKMSQLAHENRSLNDRVDLLMKELQVLKSLYRELNQDIPTSAVKALERVNVR